MAVYYFPMTSSCAVRVARLTPLPTPVDVNPGDTVRVTCTHDATLRQKLPELNKLPPRYVVWGDGTSDEMCLGLLTVSAG